ncbi:MAG: 23S rRNA (adenine(2503)-C(2))-methyltransferase RlmN [bacterium]|nr:MAG: 23S rRNA (adenine(2503)-C(2))-methyltransferase RlmN [bacterium]
MVREDMRSFFDLGRAELEQLLSGLDTKPFRRKQLLKWVYLRGVGQFESMTDMPLPLREELSRRLDLHPMREVARNATDDGTVKFLHILEDGALIESVLIPEEGHHTLCLSTQSGCAMDCVFCDTARAGAGRNLTAGEILAQIVYAVRYLGDRARLRNLVFMGMGEPLQNLDALVPALGIILDEDALGFSPRRVTVSTCGWVPGMERLGSTGTDVNLAVSLNATDDRTRSLLMPVNRKYPLARLMDAVRDYPLRARSRITFEYVLIEDINDSDEDVRRLVKLLEGIPSKVNLIPCNVNSSGLRGPGQERVRAFQEALLEKGVLATLRKSRGQDIQAACGQLRASCGQGGWT